VKFLVESFDWTKRQVAARLGIAPETLSRYEQGAYRISPAVDRLLRLMVAVLYVRDQELASAVVSNPIAGKTADPLKLTLRLDQSGEYQVISESQTGHQVAA
jgi:transcriptional regulator with XRE-family HTH domain